ncbi:MAG: hypothetical protein G01um10148_957 [Parcubacteria group bacterium Gr01-1014_8]|nr:MAG: hypothetical protein G01um10148_957 [Parcubacteria group bacterium Gr01-1014_8]
MLEILHLRKGSRVESAPRKDETLMVCLTALLRFYYLTGYTARFLIRMPDFFRKDLFLNTALFVVTIAGLYFAIQTYGNDSLRTWIEGAGVLGPVILIAAKASTIIFAPLSGALLYPLGGALFGFWKALVYLVIGDAIGGTVAFYISRRLGRAFVERMVGDSGLLGRILSMMGTVKGFLITRVLLITAQDIVAYAAGLTRLSFLPYIVIHIGVSLVPTILLTASGSLLLEDMSFLNVGLIFFAMSIIGAISMFFFLRLADMQPPKQEETAPPA